MIRRESIIMPIVGGIVLGDMAPPITPPPMPPMPPPMPPMPMPPMPPPMPPIMPPIPPRPPPRPPIPPPMPPIPPPMPPMPPNCPVAPWAMIPGGRTTRSCFLVLLVTETVIRPSPRPEASTPTSPWLMASSRLYVGMFSSSVAGCLAVAMAFVLALVLVLASSADTRLNDGSTTSRAAARARSPVVACRIEHLSVPRDREPFVRF